MISAGKRWRRQSRSRTIFDMPPDRKISSLVRQLYGAGLASISKTLAHAVPGKFDRPEGSDCPPSRPRPMERVFVSGSLFWRSLVRYAPRSTALEDWLCCCARRNGPGPIRRLFDYGIFISCASRTHGTFMRIDLDIRDAAARAGSDAMADVNPRMQPDIASSAGADTLFGLAG